MRNLWSSRRLLRDLVLRELRSRVVGSAGGWVWLLARPLLSALAYFFVFALVFQVRLGPETGMGFGLFLLAGLLPWTALNEAVISGTTSLLDSANLLKKTALPLELFPARTVLAVMALYAPVVWLYGTAVMLFSRGTLDWGLLLPLWLALQLLMTYFFSVALALLAAALRDVVQLVGLVTSVWLFVSPVLYPLERVPEALAPLLWLNPGTPLVLGYHALILHGRLPDPAVWIGMLGWTLVLGLFARLLLRRVREQVVDWL